MPVFLPVKGWAQPGKDSTGDPGSGFSSSEKPYTIQFDSIKETLDIEADSAPIRSVLNGISTATGVVIHMPRNFDTNVTLSFKDVPLERAVQMVLGSSGNAAMVYTERLDSSGKGRAVLSEVRIVGAGSAVAPSPSRPTRSPRSSVSPQNPNPRSDVRSLRGSRNKMGGENPRSGRRPAQRGE